MSSLLEYLEKRIMLSGSELISFDELAEWPIAEVQELKEQGKLVQADDADGIICTQCPEECWKEVEIRQKDGRTVGVIHCEDEDCGGLIPVEMERLQEWEIVIEKALPKGRTVEQHKKTAKPLNVRVANAVIKHQNANSDEIAKMVESTPGSVRTTPAWKMRKQLRQRYDTKKGWKDKDGNYDAFDASQIAAEHYDVYQMFQDYKSGKNPDYPSIERIADKLEVKEARAKELLKQAQSMLGFEANKID